MKKLLTLIVLTLFVNCTRTVYVPQTTTQTQYRDRVKVDSVYVRDSIRIVEKGDTVTIFKDRYHYINRLVRDTVSRVDSVSYPVLVDKIVEVNKLNLWQRWWMRIGQLLAVAIILYIVYKAKGSSIIGSIKNGISFIKSKL